MIPNFLKKKEKKGEKKTPKTTQWSGVGKSFATTFASKESLKDVPKEFEDGLEKVKQSYVLFAEVIKVYQKVGKCSQAMLQGSSALSKGMYDSVEQIKNEELQMFLGKSYEVIGALNNFTAIFNEKIVNFFVAPLNDIVNRELAGSKNAHKQWQNARIEYDVVRGKNETLLRGNWDGVKLFVSESQLNTSRDNEMKNYTDTCNKIGDSLWQRDIVGVRALSTFIQGYRDYMYETYSEFVELDPLLDDLEQKLKDTEILLSENSQDRMVNKMKDATKAFDERYYPLIDLLSAEDLGLVNAVAVTSGSEQEEILRTVIYILDAHKKTMPIIFLTIEKEVSETTDASTLFRGNTCATKLMSQFTRMTGFEYLSECLSPLLNELLEDPNGYEVDPNKISEGNVEDNMVRLISMTERILNSILGNCDHCPPPFKLIANHLQDEIVKKFPDAKYTAVGGFIFLRFFCPAIMSPDSQGLIDGVIDGNARRPLILISKSIQNLSNNIKYGQKEPFMEPMNAFIDQNRGRVEEFFDFLSEPIDAGIDYEPLSGLSEAMSFHIPSLHHKIVQNLEKIAKNLVLYKNDDIIPELCRALGSLGAVDVEILEEPGLKKMKKKKT